MNNKGQSLVLFVLLLPLILIVLAYIFDSAVIVYSNNRLKNIADNAFLYKQEGKTDWEITKYVLMNDKDIEIVAIDEDLIHLKLDVDSYFGKIIGLDKYHLETKKQE